MKRSASAWVVVVLAAAALSGCGASRDPLREVIGATSKTLGVS